MKSEAKIITPENLDAFADADALWAWGDAVLMSGHPDAAYRRHPNMAVARSLFPERPKGYMAATAALGHYAHNKAVAMRERAAGRIETAVVYETICDRIYERLPEYARFW